MIEVALYTNDNNYWFFFYIDSLKSYIDSREVTSQKVKGKI